MRCLVNQAVVSAFIGLVLCSTARSQKIEIQVSDYHQKPISGTVLSAKSAGTSTTPPTDVAGKTQIVAVGVQPGDPLSLVLVRAPGNGMIIMSPYGGRAIVPKPSGFIEVVLGAPGNKWALRDPRVVWSWTAAIVDLNKRSDSGADGRARNLARVAGTSGFTPEEIDQAIRSNAEVSSDPSQKALAAEYLKEYQPL